jgi:hypothetical protein
VRDAETRAQQTARKGISETLAVIRHKWAGLAAGHSHEARVSSRVSKPDQPFVEEQLPVLPAIFQIQAEVEIAVEVPLCSRAE